MKLSDFKTVPQWVPQLMAICLQLFQLFGFAKATRVGKSYFLAIGLLMASPATLYAVAPGNALSFNGATYVQLPATYSNMNFSGTSNFTISMWFKGNNMLYKQRSGSSGQGEIFLCSPATAGGAMLLGFGDGTGWDWLSPTQPVNTNVWNHVAITKSGSTLSLYFNGLLDKSMTTARNPTQTIGTLYIGADNGVTQFNGLIDEVQIWNTALTAAQIQANMVTTLASNGSGLVAYYHFDQSSGTTLPDSTADVYHGTIIGTATWVPSTWNIPDVTTGAVSAITTTTASVGGNVIYGGIATVTARGICYATSANPTSPCITTGTGTGAYTSSLTGLVAGTAYYARAYATNSEGTKYGSDVTFTTRYIPVIAQGTAVSATMSEDASPTAWTSPTITATDGNSDMLTWTLATPATHGTATVTGTGASPTISYSPATNYYGADSFVVQVADVDGTDTLTVNVTVTSVNDAPVATAGTLTTLEDTVGNGTVTGTDVEGSTLTYYVVTNGSQGTAAINSTTGAYTYTPTANLNGSDSFTFKVNDGTADSTPATITVTITPVNDIPSFSASDPPAVLENTGTHTFPNWATFTHGPANETDNVLTYTVSNVSNPSLFASLPSVNTSGTLTYTLATNQSGTSTVDVTVQDTGGTANGGIDLSTASQFTLGVKAPELQVTQGTTVQANGSTYDFGAVLITQTSPVITFTIENVGTSDLSLTGTPKLALTGDAAVDFKVVDQTTNTMVPGGHTTFMVTFVPTVMGPRTATLTLLNNDSDETIDTLVLQGQGLTPNIKISQGSTEIPLDGSFDIGLVGLDHLVSYPFAIENVGNSDLRLTGGTPISLSGMSAGEFNVDTTATQSVLKAGEKTEFLLNLIPVEVGPKTVTLSLPNDDLEQGNYSFTVTAQGTVSKYLQVTLTGSGTGTVTSQLPNMNCLEDRCQQPVIDAPQWVYLTALPVAGSAFTGWSGDPACQAEGKVFILADTACVATFELQSYELSVGRLGQGKVTGPGFDCPPDCTETVLYGTEVQLEAKADREWIHTGWKGRCDQTGKVKVTNAYLCHAVFEPDLRGPNLGDGNGDGVADAYQPNVISLPDKVSGSYVTFAVQPDTCAISDVYTDLPENYGQPVKNKPMPQGLIYFELACPQAQVSLYYHAVKTVKRNFIFRKYGPLVPGNEQTVSWYLLPNVTFEAVMVDGNPVVKATYTLTDGELGDSTGVDGRIVDPGGIVVK